MKTFYLLACLFIPLATLAQKPFIINGTVTNLKTGDKVYLIIEGTPKIDSVQVIDGQFRFTGNSMDTREAKLIKNVNPSWPDDETRPAPDFVRLYIEAGNISITSVNGLKNSIVKGTSTNEEMLVLIDSEKAVKEKLLAHSKRRALLDNIKDKELVKQSQIERTKILEEYDPIRYEFIENHPSSIISLNLLGILAQNKEKLSKVEVLFSKLDKKLKEDVRSKLIIEAIELNKNTAAVGKIAPDFLMYNVNGKPIKLADFKGKFLFIDFWASWCMPCRKENPNVVSAYNKYRDKGFAVLGISMDGQKYRNDWLKAIKEDSLDWEQVADFKEFDGIVAKKYAVNAIPSNFLIDPSGKIIAKNLKGDALHDKLEALFKK